MFHPDLAQLQRICFLIQQANSGTDSSRYALAEFENLYTQQDFFSYLAFIFQHLEGTENLQLRLYAGWALKRCVRVGGPCDPRTPMLQSASLQCLADPNADIRRAASSVLTTMVESGGLGCWGGEVPLMSMLCGALQGKAGDMFLDGVLRTIVKLCEDHFEALDAEVFGYPSQEVLPALIECLWNPIATQLALDGIVALMQSAALHADTPTNAILRTRSEQILNATIALATSEASKNNEIKKNICRAFVLLLGYNTETLESNLTQITRYMLEASKDRDSSVAIEACEIWSALVQLADQNQTLGDVLFLNLTSLIPVLLDGMIYSAEEIGMLQSEPDDWRVPDPAEGPRRRHNDEDDTNTEDDESDDGSGDEGGTVSQWTVRKCCAIALDDLAGLFEDQILGKVLGEVDQRMRPHNHWDVMEGAVLALGAIAEGCMAGMRQHLPSLIPRLISLAEDGNSHILLRTIAFWTLSRYAPYIVEAETQTLYYAFQSITAHMHSDSKSVQGASTSALITFIEASPQSAISPILSQLVPVMHSSYAKFQVKNTCLLYDAVIALCRKMGKDLVPFRVLLLEPIQQKWTATPNDKTSLCGIFVVLAAIVQAVGADAALADGALQRCFAVLEENLRLRKESLEMGHEPPEADFITTGLDLLSAMSVYATVTLPRDFITMLKDFASDPISGDIRQSALGCIGDLFTRFPAYMGQDVADVVDFLNLCVSSLDQRFPSATSNAAWCVGEIASSQPANSLGPCIETCARALTQILVAHKAPKNVLSNSALSLGRLSAKAPDQFAPHLGIFFRQFCVQLRAVSNSPEKEDAMVGILQAATRNPSPMVDSIVYFLDAVSSLGPNLQNQTFSVIREVLHGLKANCAEVWRRTWSSLPPKVSNILTERYGC